MVERLKERLLQIAKERIPNTDVSHDFEHALSVLANAERIAERRTQYLRDFLEELKIELKGE